MDRNDLVARLALQKGYVSRERLSAAQAKLPSAGADLALELAAAGLITKDQFRELASLEKSPAEAEAGAAAEPEVKAPERVGSYELIPCDSIDRIGQETADGPFGQVYRARLPGSSRLVALKVLSPSAVNDEYLARLGRLAAGAENVPPLDHPNIAKLIELGHDEARDVHFCVMESPEGRGLLDVIRERRSLAEKDVIAFARQMAEALRHAYGLGLVHGDVSPAKIVITPEGLALLVDFGLAASPALPHYASPEQARGDEAVDTRSDMYSLGATMYHAATGRAPFAGVGEDAAGDRALARVGESDTVPWPSEVNPEVSQGLSRVIAKMMAKEPQDRYGTPAELALDLDIIGQGREPVIASASTQRSTVAPCPAVEGGTPAEAADVPSPLPKGMAKAAAAFVPLAALAVVAFLVLRGGSREREETGPAAQEQVELTSPGPRLATELTEETERESPEPSVSSVAESTGGAGAKAEARAKELFDAAARLAADSGDDFPAAIAAFEKVRKEAGATSYRAKAAEKTRALRRSWKEKAKAALEAAAMDARSLAERGDYDAAVARLRSVPKGLAVPVRRELNGERARVEAEASRRLEETLVRAEKLLADGKVAVFSSLLDSLGSVTGIRFKSGLAAERARIERLRERAAKSEQDRAAARLKTVLEELVRLIEKGDIEEALALAEEAAGRKELAGSRKKLESAAGVARAFAARRRAIRLAVEESMGRELRLRTKGGPRRGEVEAVTDGGMVLTSKIIINRQVRGTNRHVVKWEDLTPEAEDFLARGWRPEGSAGYVALAFIALERGDADAAERALAETGPHPFAERIRERIRVLRLGESEAAARAAWAALERKLVTLRKRKMSKREARALLEEIAAFEKEHGRTEFAASVREELAAARRRAVKTAVIADPSTVPREGLKVWLRADAGVTHDGGVVSRWEDQSGSGNHATQEEAPRRPRLVAMSSSAERAAGPRRPASVADPTGPLMTLRFDGQDDRLTLPAPVGRNDFTLIVVARTSVPHQVDRPSPRGAGGMEGQKYLFHPGQGGRRQAGAGVSMGTNGISVYERRGRQMPALAVYEGDVGEGAAVVTVMYSGRKPTIFLNGQPVSEGLVSARPQVTAPTDIGSGERGAFAGDVAEILIYDRAIFEGERLAAESYLSAKYRGVRLEDAKRPPVPPPARDR